MPWRKILYEKQDYPDNFSGPEFLEGLKTNVTAETYSLRQSLVGSLVLAEELSLVCLFALSFAACEAGTLPWEALLGLSTGLTLAGAVLTLRLRTRDGYVWTRQKAEAQLRSALVFLGFGFGLSPVLRTLTETISTDTIYAMSAGMFLLSLLFHDYGVDVSIVSGSFALNGRLFGVVCLVSRLGSAAAAFALLGWALALFALWPELRGLLLRAAPSLGAPLRVGLSVGVVGGVAALSRPLAAVLFSLQAAVCLLCPLILVRLQDIKSTIHGPWDEAVIRKAES